MFSYFSPYNFMPLSFGKWELSETVDNSWAINGNATTYNFDKMGFHTNAWLLNSTSVILFLTLVSFIHPVITLAKITFPEIAYLKNLDLKWKDGFIIFTLFLIINIMTFNSLLNF